MARLQCAVRNVQPRWLQPQLPSTLPEPRFVPRLPSNYKAGPTEPQNITAVLKDAGSEWLPANKEHWPANCFCDEQVSAIEAAAKGKAGNHGEPVPSCMHPHLYLLLLLLCKQQMLMLQMVMSQDLLVAFSSPFQE